MANINIMKLLQLPNPKSTKHRALYEAVNGLIERLDNLKPKQFDIVPSPRIDWCGDCQKEHGYDCPKDKEWCACPFPTSLNDDDCDSCALPILTPPEDTPTKSWSYTLDGATGNGYITIRGNGVAETAHINDKLNIDLDSNGEVVGIELL